MNDFREYSAAFHVQNDDILHFGILGMKWGVRRYQNPDGSLTPLGKKRYGQQLDSLSNDYFKKEQKENEEGRNFYKNHKRYQELYKKRNSLDDNEYKEMEMITQVEAKKALEKFTNDTIDSRNKIYDEFLKINKGNKKKAFTSTVDFIENKRNLKEREARIANKFKADTVRRMKETLLQKAKSKGMYDLDFLETVQNDWFMVNDPMAKKNSKSKGAKEAMLKEYEKYLEDREKYMSSH